MQAMDGILERQNRVTASKTAKSSCNCTALRKATRRVSQLYDSALEPCGLRATQRAILSQIDRSGAPPLAELAEALVMDRGALTHNLKPLERDGFVEIKVDRVTAATA
jgi:DNA-binding MarR family transcriptional regulator